MTVADGASRACGRAPAGQSTRGLLQRKVEMEASETITSSATTVLQFLVQVGAVEVTVPLFERYSIAVLSRSGYRTWIRTNRYT